MGKVSETAGKNIAVSVHMQYHVEMLNAESIRCFNRNHAGGAPHGSFPRFRLHRIGRSGTQGHP